MGLEGRLKGRERITASKRREAQVIQEGKRRFKKSGRASATVSEVATGEGPTEEEDTFREYERQLEDELEMEDHVSDESGDVVKDNVSASSVAKVKCGRNGRFVHYSDDSDTSALPKGGKKKVRHGEKDKSWILTESFEGGPFDTSVLRSFGGHVAKDLWSNLDSDRGVLKCYSRERSIKLLNVDWKLEDMDIIVHGYVVDSGLNHLKDSMLKKLNVPLLCAFIERWQPDTNTFHMKFGEIAILLHDVMEIMRIPIEGRVCTIPDYDSDKIKEGICELFALKEPEIDALFEYNKKAQIYKGGGMLTEVFKLFCGDKQLGCKTEAQGYLMYLLGSTLFVEKSNDRIKAFLYQLVRELPEVKEYAWGAGTLAFLYRQLGVATRADCKGISGCLTLLQAWIYEYFPTLRPVSAEEVMPGVARA